MALFFLYSILYGWGTISDLFFGVLSRDKLVLYKNFFFEAYGGRYRTHSMSRASM